MDLNIVGAVLVVAVIGIIVLYALVDFKKKTNHLSSPKVEPSGVKCENCGGSTVRIDVEKVKCQYCGRVSYNLLPQKQVFKQEETQPQQPREPPKQHNVKIEYSDLVNEADLPFANSDPLMDFANDSAIIQKKLNKEFLEDASRE